MAWLLTCFLVVSSFLSSVALAGAQPELKKKTLKIGTQSVRVELAETPSEQEQGLMFRTKLKDGDGMLFVFPDERPRYFWMKNTFIDLAIGYFDANRKLIDIQEMKGTESVMEERPPAYPSAGPAQFALEVPKGWFKKHKVKIGETFSLK